MNLNIGDTISVISDELNGKIIAKTSQNITMLSDDGFEYSFHQSEVVRIDKDISSIIENNSVINKDQAQLEQSPNIKITQTKSTLEVDLHIHNLVEYSNNMSNFEMISVQKNTITNSISHARKSRIKTIIFIHGVGQGVLKKELISILKNTGNLSWYDASYQKYGVGATEVTLF